MEYLKKNKPRCWRMRNPFVLNVKNRHCVRRPTLSFILEQELHRCYSLLKTTQVSSNGPSLDERILSVSRHKWLSPGYAANELQRLILETSKLTGEAIKDKMGAGAGLSHSYSTKHSLAPTKCTGQSRPIHRYILMMWAVLWVPDT